jgi:hypothetical protein
MLIPTGKFPGGDLQPLIYSSNHAHVPRNFLLCTREIPAVKTTLACPSSSFHRIPNFFKGNVTQAHLELIFESNERNKTLERQEPATSI